jgi:hypothetical protein
MVLYRMRLRRVQVGSLPNGTERALKRSPETDLFQMVQDVPSQGNPKEGSLPKVPDAISKIRRKQIPFQMVSDAASKENSKYVLFQTVPDSP